MRVEALRDRLSRVDELAKLIEEENKDLGRRLRPIVDAEKDRLSSGLRNVADSSAPWQEFAVLSSRANRLFRECLGFASGAAARRKGLEDGVADVADRLLHEVASRWEGWGNGGRCAVVLSDGEFVDLFSGAIRLRYPTDGVWSLPVVMHEFGHWFAEELTVERFDGGVSNRTKPVKAVLDKAEQGGRTFHWYFIHELFADVFATYVLGPAYAYTCLCLRFDPADAHEAHKPAHPSGAMRAQAILRVLDALDVKRRDDERNAGDLRRITADVAGVWDRDVRSAGSSSQLEEKDATYVDGMVAQFLADLRVGLPTLEFDGSKATMLVLDWKSSRRDVSRDENLAASILGEAGLVDVLNAAWLRRREADRSGDYDAVSAIGEQALSLCGAVASSAA